MSGTCSPRDWPNAGCLPIEGVSWSQWCHSKPGEPGRALPVGERLAGVRRERANTSTSVRNAEMIRDDRLLLLIKATLMMSLL